MAALQRGVVGEKVFACLRRGCHTVGDVLYGMTLYDMVRGLRRQRADVEHLFVLVAFGDMVGLPIIPPYCTPKPSALRCAPDRYLEATYAAGA